MLRDFKNQDDATHPRLITVAGLLLASFLFSGMVVIVVGNYFEGLQIILGEICLILPALAYALRKGFDLRSIFRFRRVSISVVLASTLLGLSLPVLSDEIDRIVGGFIKVPPEFEEIFSQMFLAETAGEWFNLVLGTVVVAAFVEEMLFRGMLLKALEKRFEIPLAIFLSAFIFATFHPYVWLVQVLLIGCVFGYMAQHSRSIWPGLIVHSLNNLLSVTFANLEIESLAWYNWRGHVHPTAIVIAACFVFYSLKWFHRLAGAPATDSDSEK